VFFTHVYFRHLIPIFTGVAEILIKGRGQIEKNIVDVNLVTFFGDVIMMTSLKWRHNYFWSSISS